METKEAIEILSEIKSSPCGWQSTSDAIDHVIARIQALERRLQKKSNLATELDRRANKIQELEKQLAETENCRKIACGLLKDWEAGRIISNR